MGRRSSRELGREGEDMGTTAPSTGRLFLGESVPGCALETADSFWLERQARAERARTRADARRNQSCFGDHLSSDFPVFLPLS
jgi:hypothetical protein